MPEDNLVGSSSDKWQRWNLFVVLVHNPYRIGRSRCLENPRPEGRNIL
jgi:hypothetical protein